MSAYHILFCITSLAQGVEYKDKVFEQPLDKNNWITCGAFSPDGKLFAFGDLETVAILDTAQFKVVTELVANSKHVHNFTFSSDGRYLAAVRSNPTSEIDNAIVVWNTTDWKLHGRLKAFHSDIHQLINYCLVGGTLITVPRVGDGIHIWDPPYEPPDVSGNNRRPDRIIGGDTTWHFSVQAVSPDSKFLAAHVTLPNGSSSTRIYDVLTTEEVRTFPGSTATFVSADAVATFIEKDNKVQCSVWSIETGNLLRRIDLGDLHNPIIDLELYGPNIGDIRRNSTNGTSVTFPDRGNNSEPVTMSWYRVDLTDGSEEQILFGDYNRDLMMDISFSPDRELVAVVRVSGTSTTPIKDRPRSLLILRRSKPKR